MLGVVVEVRKLHPPVRAPARPRRRAHRTLTRAYLALGSNLGDRRGLPAIGGRRARDDGRTCAVVAVSPVYETVPVGGPSQDDYLNAVVAIDTDLDPWALLELAHAM